MVQHIIFDSPIGPLTAVENDAGLAAVYMAVHKRRPAEETLGPLLAAGVSPVLAAAQEQLGEYFAGQLREFSIPLAPAGSEFQQRVWSALRDIPYGELRSYGELAATLGDPSMAQAVGSANGRNPISIIVPCHRVVGADGSLVGYAGGLERKQFLLELENPSWTHTEALF
ncbi:methylated-DNA-[protein]-cysteine S-methyltransferase [Arthrobacter stackebrandtii]|uniref:Methylated-DNA--protein-cysteine methyltransferase n=1 Tax=Arthrobacter stackebrandtii TaxID=272161 RepID=A0ABS4YV75_9MICC|nr:methylated-DNA--[protein]-cysteine S-methyltransferase [Arthrobacter stackebrandtii]MBP2412385.1 methylated-DNA-[protein]-cysteine S-methyltransferase [Arthrobacter stackebrandtii]PYH02158.1 cysteine methyltransferase [Arthrobacter stackebrandtii]